MAGQANYNLRITRQQKNSHIVHIFCYKELTLKAAISFGLCFWHSVIFFLLKSMYQCCTVYLNWPKHFATPLLVIACSNAAKKLPTNFFQFFALQSVPCLLTFAFMYRYVCTFIGFLQFCFVNKYPESGFPCVAVQKHFS